MPVNDEKLNATANGSRSQPSSTSSAADQNTPTTDRRKTRSKQRKESLEVAGKTKNTAKSEIALSSNQKAEALKRTVSDALTARQEFVEDLGATIAYLADGNLLEAEVLAAAKDYMGEGSDAEVESDLNFFPKIAIDVPVFKPPQSASKYLPSAS